jgi:hypothetical protein
MFISTTSEAPEDHYANVTAMGHTVLDLGAGDFGMLGELPYPSTVEYWYMQGADKVIAVDRDASDLSNVSSYKNIAMNVDTPWMLEWLYLKYQPTFVKVDIEGAEIHLMGVDEEIFIMPNVYAIETHNHYLYDTLYNRLHDCNYNIHTTILLKHTPEQCKVILAERERYDS